MWSNHAVTCEAAAVKPPEEITAGEVAAKTAATPASAAAEAEV
jgi:hypothetical protein